MECSVVTFGVSVMSIANFFDYFELIAADTPRLKREAYAIRYQVYCEEFGYEDKAAFQHGLERDDFDHHAWHFLIRHKATGIFAGTARCVLPYDQFNAKRPLPAEKHCPTALNPAVVTAMGLKRGDYAEVSRLAVRRDFRCPQWMDEHLNLNHQLYSPKPGEAKSFACISACLYFALVAFFQHQSNLQALIAMMEPALMKLLQRTGFQVKSAGNLVDYHGRRKPCILRRIDLTDSICPCYQPFVRLVTEEVARSLNKQACYALEIA